MSEASQIHFVLSMLSTMIEDQEIPWNTGIKVAFCHLD